VVVSNPGARPITVRITTFGAKGITAERTEVIPGATQVYRPVPSKHAGAATQVEYFGGWIGAGWVTQRTDPDAALAASRCAASPSPKWYLPDLPTGRGQRASMVVMNPFAEDAVIDVTLRTDRRAAVRPGQLTALVVPAKTSRAIDVNAFLLQAPAERIVGGEVEVEVGRVVAAAVDGSGAGLASEIAVDDAASTSNLPIAGVEAASTLAVLNPRQRRSDLSVVAQNDQRQQVVSGVEGESVGPQSAKAVPVSATDAAGVGVEATNHVGVAVQRRATGTGGDPVLVGPAVSGERRWLVLSTLPPAGGRSLLVLQNPGDTLAQVRVELIGPTGPIAASPSNVQLPAGRALFLDVSRLADGEPVTALVTTSGGTIVVGASSYGPGGAGFAATLGIPIPTPR
jgi:hypothetical protein